jgi:molybdopterin synthase catalytic subunit
VPVKVQLFAGLKSRHGAQILLEANLPVSVAELRCILQEQAAWSPGARIAVNRRFATDSESIKVGDEVAVIPPVSGG